MFFSAVCSSQHSAGQQEPGRPSWSNAGDPGKDRKTVLTHHGDGLQLVVNTKQRNLLAGVCTEDSPHFTDVEADTDGRCLPQTQTPSKNASFSKNNNHHRNNKSSQPFPECVVTVLSVIHTHCSTFTKAAWRSSKAQRGWADCLNHTAVNGRNKILELSLAPESELLTPGLCFCYRTAFVQQTLI